MIRILSLLIIFSISVSLCPAQPKVFLMNPSHLAALKTKMRQKDLATIHLTDDLIKQADGFLKFVPISVMDKAFTPVSGNKHDYMSQAPYFWYDSSKPNGRPYMRRDGEHNPEIKKITDHDNLSTLDNVVRTLALAWYLTGNVKYSEKASALLHHWFLDEASRMNPNLEYAQGIPGINDGRGIGIIETRSLTGIADAIGLLEGSASWSEADTKAMKKWYSDYLTWMLTSKNGNEEHMAKNNHGTWFSVQAIDFALFTGNIQKAKELALGCKKRLDSQLTKEGTFPLELARTNALGYSTFNLRAWFDASTLSELAGVDLWHYKNANGATLQTAVDWLLPYAFGDKQWSYKQIGKYNKNEFYPTLIQAAVKYNEPGYLVKANSLKNNGMEAMAAVLY